MESGRLAAVALLLCAMAFPVFGEPAGGGPKNWFHLRKSSTNAHYRGKHTVVKHHAAKHPKPQHITHSSH